MTQATTTKTAGQQLAAELRTMFNIGTRTRTYRGGFSVKQQMLDEIRSNAWYADNGPVRTEILRPGAPVAQAWHKHVNGYRIDGVLRSQLDKLSPWQFANLLGRMVDAGITNNGEGEIFFDRMAREANKPAPVKVARRRISPASVALLAEAMLAA